MKVLVTGGAGFIGSHIVNRFLSKEWEVIVLDSLEETSDINRINKGNSVNIIKGRMESVKKLPIVDLVINSAAETHVDYSFERPKDFIDASDVNTGSLIDGIYNVCNCPDAAFPHIFTGREEWFEPSESETKKQMRYYYENRGNINRAAGLERAKQFSYENIANKIKDYLSE